MKGFLGVQREVIDSKNLSFILSQNVYTYMYIVIFR